MKKAHNALAEHYLIPAVLFLLNICLAQFIHAFANDSASLTSRMVLVIAFVLLGSSLFLKKQFLLAGSILFYSLAALWV